MAPLSSGDIVWMKQNEEIQIPALIKRIYADPQTDAIVAEVRSLIEFEIYHISCDALHPFDDKRLNLLRNDFGQIKLAVKNAKLLLTVNSTHRLTLFKELLKIIENMKKDKRLTQLLRKFRKIMRKIGIHPTNEFDKKFKGLYGTVLFNLAQQQQHKTTKNATCSDDFDYLRPDKVCSHCQKGVDVKKCIGACENYFHVNCINPNSNAKHVCEQCKENPELRHDQHKNCKTCNKLIDQSNSMKCICCSIEYHRSTKCIPAGTKLLSQTQLICIAHGIEPEEETSMKTCSSCCKNRTTIKCQKCPMTFHCKCIKMRKNQKYTCTECREDRHLSYGDIVFAKDSIQERWWPAVIVKKYSPTNNLEVRLDDQKVGYFLINYFGSEAYEYRHRSEVVLFDQVKANMINAMQTDEIDDQFLNAIDLANKHRYRLAEQNQN